MAAALTRIKEKFQITLPVEVRNSVHFSIGDLVEATTIGDDIVQLRVKRLVDRHIAEGLAEIDAGLGHGPYDTAEEAIEALRSHGRPKRKR